jgi:nicotinate-nucleotide--dimethylbenzimidazole phosphoribosyltransferase
MSAPIRHAIAAASRVTADTGRAGWRRQPARPVPELLADLPAPDPPTELAPVAAVLFATDHGGASADAAAGAVRALLSRDGEANRRLADLGAWLCVVDIGLQHELPAGPGLLHRNLKRRGRLDRHRLMVEAAVEAGLELARDLAGEGYRCLLAGQVGNEPHSKWLRAAIESGADAPAMLAMLASADALAVAGTAGLVLGAAATRTPVVIAGDPTGAMAAAAFAPAAAATCVAATPDLLTAADVLASLPVAAVVSRVS